MKLGFIMDALSANEAKTHFGELLLKAQRSPVQISKNGKPVAVVLSMDDYQEMEQLKLQMLKERAHRAKEEYENGLCEDGEAFFDILLTDSVD